MKRHIPNLITLLNVFCGCIAVVFAVLNQLEFAALFVFLGIFFDFFDGLAARLLKVQSDLGVQLDSLADMITSGVVPGIVMFQLLGMSETGGWNAGGFMEAGSAAGNISMVFRPLPLLGFVITMASAYRLAKFNIDENQVSSFIGLPTPANTLLILSLPLILFHNGSDILSGIILNQWFLIALTFLSAYLLNSKIELFALKFKNWGFKDNALRYIFIVLSLVLLVTLEYLAIPFIIAFYIIASVVVKLGGNK
ncbi:CDP-alcohol phosphatidyltransferase family protein [Cytophaga sp. FL35]|uniref:CDP-alcohol phosphatidyltransferase family protein n=1 Tax=Cytophaga sp. FL35 TaxID=1904456 RepID=UPI001653A324|nr:CDP-alcohol phosphatidyltransferase family protein [Cytophaga sp. FL35]MBC6998868.1 CDP-alcohol phosphatidyltransferase family protein [Cytophaga sp. FL35]